jgi:hypothetical protein
VQPLVTLVIFALCVGNDAWSFSNLGEPAGANAVVAREPILTLNLELILALESLVFELGRDLEVFLVVVR